MYSYSIESTNLSLIILPSCCEKFSRNFLFSPKDSFFAAKKNLIFSCPFCQTIYPNVGEIFRTLSILNITVGKYNEYIFTKKKKGFIISLPTSGYIYNYLDKLIPFEKLFKNSSVENIDANDYEEYVYNLISFPSDDHSIKHVKREALLLNKVSIHCKKCDASFELADKIDNKDNIICEECGNHVKVPKKYLKEILSTHIKFQNILNKMAKEKITVIPFSLSGMFMSYTNGDNEIFKTLNQKNVV
jgi:DNA-directed RNA polymerase subunit RPC12/RpoP